MGGRSSLVPANKKKTYFFTQDTKYGIQETLVYFMESIKTMDSKFSRKVALNVLQFSG